MKVFLTEFTQVYFDATTGQMVSCDNSQFLRYLKGVYTNKERFMNNYVTPKRNRFEEVKDKNENAYNAFNKFLDFLVENYEDALSFSFKESFEISNQEFQALVFSSINITDMINTLGATRLKSDGIEVNHRKYDDQGNFTGMEKYHNVYETYEVDGEKLGLDEKLYVVKCWCTSTNKEHWLWIDDKYKDDPLNAIASTFQIHENLIPHLKQLKRQGDVLLAELNEDVHPEGEMISLTKEQYFKYLTAQS